MVSNINAMYHHRKPSQAKPGQSVSQSICLFGFCTIFMLWVRRDRHREKELDIFDDLLLPLSCSFPLLSSILLFHMHTFHFLILIRFGFHFTRYNIVFLAFTYGIPMVVMIICYYVMGRELWGSQSIGENTERQTESVKSKKKVSMETFITYRWGTQPRALVHSFVHSFVRSSFFLRFFFYLWLFVVLSVQMDVCEPYERCLNGAKMILQRWHMLLHIWNLTNECWIRISKICTQTIWCCRYMFFFALPSSIFLVFSRSFSVHLCHTWMCMCWSVFYS